VADLCFDFKPGFAGEELLHHALFYGAGFVVALL